MNNAKSSGIIIKKILLLFFILTSCVISQTLERKYFTNPNSFIVNELAHKKIIMLGDFSHGNALPFKSMITLLDEWINKVKSHKSKDLNIALILEADSEIIYYLREYLSTGNWKPFIDYWLPFNTLEWCEFCADLRSIKLKIEEQNAFRGREDQIKFEIFGGETDNVFNNPKHLGNSKEDGFKFFINKRDSLTAENIIRYLERNKTQKALLFYGNAHLINNYVKKDVGRDNQFKVLTDSERKGYYLVHYLKEKYGDDSVLSINQLIVPDHLMENTPFAAAKDSNIFVLQQNIPWNNADQNKYDSYILHHEMITSNHLMSNVFSIKVIKADIKKMIFLEKYLPGELAKNYFNRAKESLELLTGLNYDSVSRWQGWIENNHYDGVSRLDSKEFEQELYDTYYRNPNDDKIKMKLYSLGFGQAITGKEMMSKSLWEKEWKSNLNNIKFINAIGLIWVGTDEEKLNAKNYLDSIIKEKQAGENSEQQSYLRFFRNYYMNLNY